MSLMKRFLAPEGREWVHIGPVRRLVTTLWALIECLLLSGITYGWHSAIIVFKEDGIFSDYCHTSNITTQSNFSQSTTSIESCSMQDEMFNLAFMVCGTLMTIGCAVFGHIQYLWGTRTVKIIDFFIFLLGTTCIAFMERETSWLLFIGAPAIAIAGPPIFLVNIQVANLYGQLSAIVVCLCTGAYDVSATMQLIVKYAYHGGVSRRFCYLFLSFLLIFNLIGAFFIFPKTYIPKRIEYEVETYVISDDCEKAIEKDTKQVDDRNLLSLRSEKQRYVAPTLNMCIKSPLFLLHVAWLSLLQLRFYYYVGSLNVYLKYMTAGDQELVDWYTNVCLYIQLVGFIGAPIMGCFIAFEIKRHRGAQSHIVQALKPHLLPLLATCASAILLSGVVLIPLLQVVVPIFVLFIVFRSFLYGLVSAYIKMLFPARYFGTLWGLTMIVGGLCSALQYPLFIWMNTAPISPIKVNSLLFVISCLSLIHPIYIWVTCRRPNLNKTLILQVLGHR